MQNGKTMLNSKKFHQNFHPLLAKMMEKYFVVKFGLFLLSSLFTSLPHSVGHAKSARLLSKIPLMTFVSKKENL
jgi:hypothetical protein